MGPIGLVGEDSKLPANEPNVKATRHSKVADAAIVLASLVGFSLLFGVERGFLLSMTTFMVLVLVQEYWKIVRRAWFLVFISIVFLLHVTLIFSIDLPDNFTATVLFVPLFIIEWIALFFIVAKIEKVLASRTLK
jgi:hypothetical protein